jgi:hypothetical protein
MEEIWDNTKLQSYTCLMRGKYAMEEDLVGKEPQVALAFGIAFHKASEVWTHESITPHELPTLNPVEQGKLAFKSVWEQELPLEVREKLEFEGDRRSYGNFCRLFEAYVRKFPIEMFDKIVATEQPFTIPLGITPRGRMVAWSGILDRAVLWQGGLYYVDIKTSSYPLNVEKYRISGQMVGYAWAGQQLGVGQFDGIMIQGIEVKQAGDGQVKLKKDGTPYARQSKTADDLVQQDSFVVRQDQIEEWKRDTLQRIDDIYAARERNHWPMNRGTLCEGFGGKGCEFRLLCEAPPELREGKKELFYGKRKWNPINRGEA